MTQVRPADHIGTALRRLREPRFAHVGHLVVVRGGDTVAAHAFGGRGLDEPADVFSVTKSVLATVTLLAVRDGRVSLDATLGGLLGERVPLARRGATVRHAVHDRRGALRRAGGHRSGDGAAGKLDRRAARGARPVSAAGHDRPIGRWPAGGAAVRMVVLGLPGRRSPRLHGCGLGRAVCAGRTRGDADHRGHG
ncbi:serine hydrolase [Planomonospora sp. ID91781]|nr:serine hydrolase [Planomonospora sp. ID91781]